MAANLKSFARARLLGCWLLLNAVPLLAIAQELADPTRPPEQLSARPGPAKAETNELQSVIIAPTRRAAIIHGQTVELGGKVGDFRLIEVNESGVVLQGAKGLEVLSLFPNIKVSRKAAKLPDREQPARKARAEEGK